MHVWYCIVVGWNVARHMSNENILTVKRILTAASTCSTYPGNVGYEVLEYRYSIKNVETYVLLFQRLITELVHHSEGYTPAKQTNIQK